MKARMKATMEFQAPTAKEPARNLTASIQERERGSNEEFAKRREANPNFTSKELLNQSADIRIAWRISKPGFHKKKK